MHPENEQNQQPQPPAAAPGQYPAWEFGRLLLSLVLCALVVAAFALHQRCG